MQTLIAVEKNSIVFRVFFFFAPIFMYCFLMAWAESAHHSGIPVVIKTWDSADLPSNTAGGPHEYLLITHMF